MPKVPILMPQLGESIAEATIVQLGISIGDSVEADQEVIEVETNKAAMGVTTLCGGTVVEIRAEEGESYPVGTILGVLEATDEEVERTGVRTLGAPGEPAPEPSDEPPGEQAPAEEAKREANVHFATDDDSYEAPREVVPSVKGLPVPAGDLGAHYISPRMRARMNDLGLREADISAVAGSGKGGRVTVEDLEQFLDYIERWPSTQASPMRLAVADAMRRSWTRPLATVGLPVPMDRLLDHRRQQDPKPGLTLYVLRAFALAMAEEPTSAGYLIGEKVVHPRSVDLGVAVQVEDGVVVPVLRSVDNKRVAELVELYALMVERARRRRLTEDDTQAGIATVTNFGTFGLTWGTPIPLPNETLILGIGAGVKRPVWSPQVESFVPAIESELVLTFDHRVVDGGGAGMLLNRVRELMQEPEKL
jgi:pyruvate/2-oxoglutarate dehydrogenase complex dihydrolipoamide acyltransferase (E2) component